MPQSIPADEQLLPTPESLEIADHAIGIYLSELDALLTRVARETAPISVAEWLALEKAVAPPADLEINRDHLLRLIVFCADALRDAQTIAQQAGELQGLLLAVFHDETEPDGVRDPAGWRAHRDRILDWHRAHVDGLEQPG